MSESGYEAKSGPCPQHVRFGSSFGHPVADVRLSADYRRESIARPREPWLVKVASELLKNCPDLTAVNHAAFAAHS